jgi:hypothetical protein
LRLGFAAVAAASMAAGFALMPRDGAAPGLWSTLPELPAAPVFAAGWIVVLAAIAYGLFSLQSRRITIAVGAVAVLSHAYLFLVALPAIEEFRPEKAFAQRVRHMVGPDLSELALYRTREFVYYLDPPTPLREFDSDTSVSEAAAAGRLRWLIVRERDLAQLQWPFSVEYAAARFPWDQRPEKTRPVLIRFDRNRP